ncbi:MAG: MFS transporter [Betaproteobacteria bacterium]
MSALARFLLVLAAGYASAASLGKLVPHLDWLTRAYGVPLAFAGFAVSCVMLPGALAGWSFGSVVDRFGAKRVAVAGLLTAATASLAGAFAPSFAALVAIRIAEGFGYSMLVISATVIIVSLAASRGALALSVWSSFAPIGFALGQWAGAYASGPDPLRTIGMAHAATLAAAALCLYLLMKADPPAHRPPPSREALRYLPALWSALSMGIACGILLAAVALAPVVLAAKTGLAVTTTASLTALAALPAILGRFAPGWALQRGVTALAFFIGASIVAAASLLGSLLAAVPLWLALVLFAVFQISAGALPGLLSAMLPHVSPAPGALGTVTGMSNQMANLGNLVGPPLVLALYAAAGPVGAVAALVAALGASLAAVAPVPVYRKTI